METLNRLWRAFVKARTVSAISQLSDRQLKDIGIAHRSGIRAHVDSIYEG